MKKIAFVFVCLVMSVSLMSLAWGGEADKPYKIGVSLNLTGVNADFALSCKAGTEVAAEQINARGGILGRRVELVIRDDKLDPDEAIRVLKDFHLNAKCDAYLLSPPGVCQTPQLRYAKEHNLLSFAQQGQDMYYLNDLMYPYYFIMGPTAMQEAYGLAKYVAKWKGIKSFVTFAPDYSWGHSNVEAFTAKVKELRPGIKCLGHFYPPLEELEFGSYITGMLAKRAVLVVTWIFGTSLLSLVKQATAYGLVDKMKVLSWVHHDEIFEGGKDVPSGLTVEADNEFWTNRKNQNPYYEEFEKAYKAKRGGRLPALGGCQHYDMVMTLMQGIKKAGSFDKDKIARAIEGSTFMTLRGPQFMRPINHAFDTGVYFGVTKYDDKLGYCTVVDVVEIPGAEIMVSDEEYLKYRKKKNIDFKPWHENWYKSLPWAE